MSDRQKTEEPQQPPSEAPPVYSTATPTVTKDETPQSYQKPTAPAPAPAPAPVPTVIVGQQYQQQLFAACARGEHLPTTKHGICGILTAIFCFPIGLICLFTDMEIRCARCGIKLS